MLWYILAVALAQDAESPVEDAEASTEASTELIPGVTNAGLPPAAVNQLKPLDARPITVVGLPSAATTGLPMAPAPIQQLSGLPAPPPPLPVAGLPPMAEPLPVINADLPEAAKILIIDPDGQKPETTDKTED